MLPKNRIPTHPGEILLYEFLEPLKMSQLELAKKMGVSVQRINTLINGKRDMTPETAVLLAKVFKTSEQCWMNLQTNRDIYIAKKYLEEKIKSLSKNSKTIVVHKKQKDKPLRILPFMQAANLKHHSSHAIGKKKG